MIRVGIIGYGTISRDLARYIENGDAGDTKLVSILVRNKSKIQSELPITMFEEDPDRFFAKEMDVIVEAAGHEAIKQYAEQALLKGCDLVVAGVGAFADEKLYQRVLEAARKSGKKVIVPSCAIGGLDRIQAATFGPMDDVTLTSSKPPNAWYGTIAEEKVNLEEVSEPVCIFEGTARESALLFPESVNVSAALSLAGVGFSRTKVRVMVNPHITKNIHEIHATGKFGEIKLQISNTPSDNPKTGWIVAMSMAKVLKGYTSNFVIGL